MPIAVSRRSALTAALAAALIPAALLAQPASASMNNSPNEAIKFDENIKVTRIAPDHRPTDVTAAAQVEAGAERRFGTTFVVTSSPDRTLLSITDHAPAGFTYVPGSAWLATKSPEGDVIGGYIGDEEVAVSASGESVTVTAPDGGWHLQAGEISRVTFSVAYRVSTAVGSILESGATFTTADRDGERGWERMGAPVLVTAPAPTGFGSSS